MLESRPLQRIPRDVPGFLPGMEPLGQAVKEGASILHYRILSRLGEGGMGVVYRAEDSRLGRTVALKILREDLAADEDWERRFQREVRAASAITHPGIATIYDVHRDGATVFYTMEFVEGRNLRKLLEDGPLPLPDLLRGSLQIAEAMAEAHRKGIVHRDLKPENVVASDSGFFKVLDFGLARFVTEELTGPGGESRMETISRDTTGSGRLVGTVSYMSPEQVQGIAVDGRSDIFSIGVLIHELATGVAPFRRNNAIATFHAIVHEDPKPMRSLRPEVPQELEWVVSRCLAKDPRDRYQSASDLAEDLRALARVSDSGDRRASGIRPYRGARPARKRLAWAAGAAIAIAVLAAIGAWVGLSPRHERVPAAPPPAPALPAPPAVVLAEGGQRSIAVAGFTNNSPDPADAWLGQGVPQMLTTELAGSPDLKVVSTQRLNDLLAMAGRSEMGTLDQATATELARWAGAGIVVSGSIFKVAGSYRIDAQASDTQTGQVIVGGKVEGKDVFQMVNRLTADLKRGLSAAAREEGAAPKVLTASEDAYRSFTRGMGLYEGQRFDQAAESFRKSVDADPSFALAQMRLGMSLHLAGNPKEGLEWIDRAAAQMERLPDREGRLIRIVQAYLGKKDSRLGEETVAAFEKAYPKDPEGALWKARADAEISEDPVAAIRVLRRILDQEPDNLAAVSLLSAQVAGLGRPSDAAGILQDYLARHPDAAEPLSRVIEAYRKAAGESGGGG